ncbi:MAG: hypothetical protein ACPG4X_14585 [Pikeienuella sp.]
MTDRSEDGWAEIQAAAPKSKSHVTVSLRAFRAGDRLQIVIPIDLWPALKNAPTQFSAWRKGAQLLLEPSDNGQFRGGWRGRNNVSYGIMIDAWDGLAEGPSDKFLCSPTIADDGAMVLVLPDRLFASGKPRAIATKQAVKPTDSPAAKRLKEAFGP